jgi:hypothetical protein
MLRIVFSTAVIWSVCTVALGQKDAAELARLRMQMGVSETAPITTAGAPTLPAERPLRVYVSTAGDASASQEVLLSIKKINEKPDKYGSIEVVDDLSKANVILVHYELTEKRREEVDNNMTMDPGSNSRILTGGKSDRWISSQVRGYVIVRSPEGFEILTRYEHKVKLSVPRKDLSDALLSVLKRQSDMKKK